MLQNSDFTDGASSSDDSDNSTGYAQNVVGDTAIPNEIVSAAGDSSHPGAFSDQVLKITGSTGAIKHVFQSIQVNGKKATSIHSAVGAHPTPCRKPYSSTRPTAR